jgi:hypothetical protein
MSKIIFAAEQTEFLKNASDVLLRNTGVTYLKDTAVLYDKFDSQDADFNAKDIKLIQLLCDVALKASGLLHLKHAVAILNMTVNFEKT